MVRRVLEMTYRAARRIAIGVIGASLLLAGIAMILLPGPAILVIPLALTILGIEFAWARRWLRRARARTREVTESWFDRPRASERPSARLIP